MDTSLPLIDLQALRLFSYIYHFRPWKTLTWRLPGGIAWFLSLLDMRALIATTVLLLVGASFTFLGFTNRLQDMVWPEPDNISSRITHRKFNGQSYNQNSIDYRRSLFDIDLKDYQSVDPVPSSRTTIRSGPIEHNAPLNPWIISHPPPPPHPKQIHAP